MTSNKDTSYHDKAARSGGMALSELEARLQDMDNEPRWRESATKCADYYDHKQSSQERVARHRETGEPMVVVNLVQRTINGALGQEAKTRVSWKVSPDSDVFADVATVLGEKLSEAQREARTDIAISDAYKSMLTTGIGWVEVKRCADPLSYPYIVDSVHRDEVWWDWRARSSDLRDAQWMIRQRWADLDEVTTKLPEFRELLEMGINGGPIVDAMTRQIHSSNGEEFESAWRTRQSFSRAQEEWLDNTNRKRVRMYQVYYKQHAEAIALVSGTKRIRFNPSNPYHQAAVLKGGAKLVRGPSYQIRRALFVGPWRLYDEPLVDREFPLVPFVCYRADDDGSPYGLVHGMIEPQDEYNERRSRLLWLLKAKQTFVDSDALDPNFNTIASLAKEVMRPDAMFVMNQNRRNANALRIDTNPSLGAEQSAVMNDAKALIQDVPGMYAPQFGSNRVGAQSGVALSNLMEQSAASLGETSDNYRTSRQLVGDALTALIAADHGEPNMQVPVGSGKRRRIITLNTTDERGLPVNSMDDAQCKVALGDISTTTAYKQQQQQNIATALTTIGQDEAARAVLLPAWLESSDLEHRAEYAQWLRNKYGVPDPNDMADQEKQQAEDQMRAQMQAQQQELAKQAQDIASAKAAAEAALAEAKALLTRAQTVKTIAEARQIDRTETESEDAILARIIAEAASATQPPQQAPALPQEYQPASVAAPQGVAQPQ